MRTLSLNQSNQLKAIAILMMLCLHLFNKDYKGLFLPIIFINDKPLSYYLSLFSDACVPIFAFVSGYGLYYKFLKSKNTYEKDNYKRIKKLFINYWIILLLFPLLIGGLIGKEGYPGSSLKFILNFLALDNSYNGAWWFFTIYVLFVLTSRFWFTLLNRINIIIYLFLLLILYVVAFYFRVYKAHIFQNEILNWFQVQGSLYFCTLFQFMLGAFAIKYDWFYWVNHFINRYFKFNFWVGFILILGLICIHGALSNLFYAPFFALLFIFIFANLSYLSRINSILNFVVPHATNLWLIHLFFIQFFYRGLYDLKYPIVIYLVLLTLCIISSFIINFINDSIKKWV